MEGTIYSHMKASSKLASFSLLLLFIVGSFSSCKNGCTEYRTYIKYTPIIKSLEEVRSSFELQSPKELENPRKIYTYNSYLMIVDEFKGFQILDNSDKTNPVALKFIKLDGCTDVAVSNGKIYANQGPDIVRLSFDDISSIEIEQRLEEVMNSSLRSGDNFTYDYTREEVTEEVSCSQGRNGGGIWFEDNGIVANAESSGSSSGSSGTGGSMARFSIVQGDLYIVDNTDLACVDISNGFSQKSSTSLGRGIETIFGTEEYLFLGTATGMLVYDRNNGNSPTYVSSISHARGCDPVVVSGSKAYVTVKGGSRCGAADDELIVVDISDIRNLRTLATHSMTSPNGLGISGDYVLICDGPAGLRIFDRSDDLSIRENEVATISDVEAYDVIPLDGYFILSTKDGVYQYDYADISNPKLLSKVY